jgi:hypothetical protein
MVDFYGGGKQNAPALSKEPDASLESPNGVELESGGVALRASQIPIIKLPS